MNTCHIRLSSIKFLWLLISMFILTSCTSLQSTPVAKEGHFHLTVLDSYSVAWPDDDQNTWATLWPALKQAYPSGVFYSINEMDVETYDWEKQMITLTKTSSYAFLTKFSCTEWDRTNSLPCVIDLGFVVALDDTPIYGAVSKLKVLENYLKIPYILISIENEKVIFSIFAAEPYMDSIKDERVKTIFSDLGKLTE